jgi:hypothetical protein
LEDRVANPLGEKWECGNCGAKFYDLGKSVPLCPKCGANAKETTVAAVTETSTRRRRRDDGAKRRRANEETETAETPRDEGGEEEGVDDLDEPLEGIAGDGEDDGEARPGRKTSDEDDGDLDEE